MQKLHWTRKKEQVSKRTWKCNWELHHNYRQNCQCQKNWDQWQKRIFFSQVRTGVWASALKMQIPIQKTRAKKAKMHLNKNPKLVKWNCKWLRSDSTKLRTQTPNQSRPIDHQITRYFQCKIKLNVFQMGNAKTGPFTRTMTATELGPQRLQ